MTSMSMTHKLNVWSRKRPRLSYWQKIQESAHNAKNALLEAKVVIIWSVCIDTTLYTGSLLTINT